MYFVNEIFRLLKKHYPKTRIQLAHVNPLELLVAVMLSAQCTDAQVNRVTPKLFAEYKTARDYAEADLKELEKLIFSTGFYKSKAKHLKQMGQKLVSDFDERVPQTMSELVTLPGVGRKTANIVLSNAFGVHKGIAVDTHVFRLSHRLGLSNGKTPEKVEADLMKLVPETEWNIVTYELIEHGRNVCTAKKPKCDDCFLAKHCPKIGVL
ncbi:endonuclease III [Candidatus Micrarchaeota archaeon]|nr:endonuclease III [Candidatus Micrarchaeota archaeon]